MSPDDGPGTRTFRGFFLEARAAPHYETARLVPAVRFLSRFREHFSTTAFPKFLSATHFLTPLELTVEVSTTVVSGLVSPKLLYTR